MDDLGGNPTETSNPDRFTDIPDLFGIAGDGKVPDFSISASIGPHTIEKCSQVPPACILGRSSKS